MKKSFRSRGLHEANTEGWCDPAALTLLVSRAYPAHVKLNDVTRPEQKLRELAAVNCLRDLYASFPIGEIESTEEPDTLVRLPSGHFIGIEVRDFAKDDSQEGSQLNAFQVTAGKIAEAARAAYIAKGGPPVLVSIYFEKNLRRLGSRDIAKLGGQIAEEVARATPSIDGPVEIHGSEVGLPEGIWSVKIRLLGPTNETFFGPMHAEFYGEILPLHIDYALERKEEKVPIYREKCDEIWLLIVVDHSKLSAWSEPSPDLADHAYVTEFDRVFLLYCNSSVFELKKGA
jgi:hypothetical protein